MTKKTAVKALGLADGHLKAPSPALAIKYFVLCQLLA